MCLSNDGILECIKYHNTCRKYSEDSKLLFPTGTKLYLSVLFESLSNKAGSTMCPFIHFEEIGKLPEWGLAWAVWLSFEWQHSSYLHFMWISISYEGKKTSSPILKRWRIWKQNNLISYRQENVNIFCNLFSRFSHRMLWNSISCLNVWFMMANGVLQPKYRNICLWILSSKFYSWLFCSVLSIINQQTRAFIITDNDQFPAGKCCLHFCEIFFYWLTDTD